MPQSKRNEMLAKFKANEAELLVCSDVAARGLDISADSHVINFDVPVNAEDYIHRIGRTGRAGLSGHAYTIATPGDARLLGAVEKMLKGPIPPLVIPELGELAVSPDAADEGARDSGRGRRGRPERGRGRPRGRERERPEKSAEEAPTQVAEEVTPMPAVIEEPQAEDVLVENLDELRERKGRKDRERGRSRQDRNSDARGAEDRARKTRRNPHGIADMDISDNVLAFGGFTPAFLLVDPYGGKGAPPARTAEDEADAQDDEPAPAETADAASSASEDASAAGEDPGELANSSAA
jgi:superfamily II DNA/RNA helicase